MSNLLDKASIILTPTAYNNGEALCVKPSDGSGDFDFSRNSAATRVNAQGLVEDVQILSSNLVQNGDFSEQGSQLITNGGFATDSNWTLISGVTYNVGGYLDFDGSQGTGSVTNTPNTTFTLNKTYKVVYEIKNYVSGTIKFRFQGGSNTIGQQQSGDGVKTEYIVCNDSSNNNFNFFGSSSFIGSIDNVSVKEVGQNWFKDANWSIGDNVATSTGGGRMFQSISALEGNTGTKVKVSFNITEVTSGGVKVDCYGAASSVITEVGTHTFTGTTTNSLNLYINNSGTGNLVGSVTNISVIEITNDTNLPRINYEGFSYQDALGSEEITNGDFSSGATGWVVGTGWSVVDGKANKVSGTESDINQTNGLATQGLSYLFSYDVNLTSGTVQAAVKGGSGQLFNTVGTHTVSEIIVAGSGPTDFKITAKSGFNGSVDNVSVKEYKGQEVVPDSGCGNWLFEPQSTNLIPYSEDFSQWDTLGDTTIEGGYLAPDGSSSAYKVSGTDSSLRISGVTLDTTTRSVYARTTSGTGQANLCSFNGNSNNLFTITEQWQRFDVNSSIINGATSFYAVDFRGDTNLSEIILWGANATNDQSYPTSYIPADGTSVTRNQDVCNNGGSVATINSAEGVLYAEIAALANENVQRVLSISDGTHNNTVKLGFLNSATDYRLFADIRLGGVNQAFLTFNFGAVAPTFKKCAIKYKQNDFALWIDGVEVATDTSGNTFSANTLNELTFTRGDAAQNFFGETKCLAVWKEALTDTELAELTTI